MPPDGLQEYQGVSEREVPFPGRERDVSTGRRSGVWGDRNVAPTPNPYSVAELARVPEPPSEVWRLPLQSETLAPRLFNRLQPAAFGLQPSVKTVYDGLSECEPLGVLLSGSGSSVFALARDAADARRIARAFESRNPGSRVFAVRTLN